MFAEIRALRGPLRPCSGRPSEFLARLGLTELACGRESVLPALFDATEPEFAVFPMFAELRASRGPFRVPAPSGISLRPPPVDLSRILDRVVPIIYAISAPQLAHFSQGTSAIGPRAPRRAAAAPAVGASRAATRPTSVARAPGSARRWRSNAAATRVANGARTRDRASEGAGAEAEGGPAMA